MAAVIPLAVILELYRNGYLAPLAYGCRRHVASWRSEPEIVG